MDEGSFNKAWTDFSRGGTGEEAGYCWSAEKGKDRATGDRCEASSPGWCAQLLLEDVDPTAYAVGWPRFSEVAR